MTNYLGSCWYRRRDRIPATATHGVTWKVSEPLCGNLVQFGQEAIDGEVSVVGIVEAVPDGTILLIPAEDICMTRGNDAVFRNTVVKPDKCPHCPSVQPICPEHNRMGRVPLEVAYPIEEN